MSEADFDKELKSLKDRASSVPAIGRALDRLERLERFKVLPQEAEETFRLPYPSVPKT